MTKVTLHLVVGHPVNLALEVLRVARLRHHQVVDTLLGSVRLRRVVADVVGLVAWRLLGFDLGAVEATRLVQLAGREDVRRGARWNLVPHERVVYAWILERAIVSLDVEVADRVLLGERCEGSQRIGARVRHCARLEPMILLELRNGGVLGHSAGRVLAGAHIYIFEKQTNKFQ